MDATVKAVEAQGVMELQDAFKQFSELLVSLGADFVICGSVALKAYGLIERDCNDLDILMDLTNPESQKVLNVLRSLCFEKLEYGYTPTCQAPAWQFSVPNIKGLCIFQCANLDEMRNPNAPLFIKSEIAVSEKMKWALKGKREKDRKDAIALLK